MILKTFDKKEIYITTQQAEDIASAVANGAKIIKVGEVFVAAGAIATMTKGGEAPKLNIPRIQDRNETREQTEARLAHNRQKMAEIKQNLITKGVLKP